MTCWKNTAPAVWVVVMPRISLALLMVIPKRPACRQWQRLTLGGVGLQSVQNKVQKQCHSLSGLHELCIFLRRVYVATGKMMMQLLIQCTTPGLGPRESPMKYALIERRTTAYPATEYNVMQLRRSRSAAVAYLP